MKKEIKELQDVWLNECDKKHCPIIDYLLHQKSTDRETISHYRNIGGDRICQ